MSGSVLIRSRRDSTTTVNNRPNTMTRPLAGGGSGSTGRSRQASPALRAALGS
jgi:hypothetical protein